MWADPTQGHWEGSCSADRVQPHLREAHAVLTTCVWREETVHSFPQEGRGEDEEGGRTIQIPIANVFLFTRISHCYIASSKFPGHTVGLEPDSVVGGRYCGGRCSG